MEHTAKEVVGPLPPANTLKASGVYAGTGHRDPLVGFYVEFDVPNKPKDRNVEHAHVDGSALINPATGARVGDDAAKRLHLGTGFFFPMHFMLHASWLDIGYWVVGLAGLAMLAALVSGVVVRRRMFREFFTVRFDKARLRGALDVHNVTGVLALPFLFVNTFSGLLIMAGFYLPAPERLMRPLAEAQERVEVARTPLPEHAAGRPGTLASVDAMMTAAKARWAARGVPGEVGSVFVAHFGDANSYVTVSRDMVDRVATGEALHFSAATGRLVHEDPPARPIPAAEGFFYGLHFQQFRHWGLAGCCSPAG